MAVGQLSFSYKTLNSHFRRCDGWKGGREESGKSVFSDNKALKISMQSQEENNSDSLPKVKYRVCQDQFCFCSSPEIFDNIVSCTDDTVLIAPWPHLSLLSLIELLVQK